MRVVGGVRGIFPVVQTPQVVTELVGYGVVVETPSRDDGGSEHGIASLVKKPLRGGETYRPGVVGVPRVVSLL